MKCANISCDKELVDNNPSRKYCDDSCRFRKPLNIRIDEALGQLVVERKNLIKGMVNYSLITNTITKSMLNILRVIVCHCEDQGVKYSLDNLYWQHRRTIEIDLWDYEFETIGGKENGMEE